MHKKLKKSFKSISGGSIKSWINKGGLLLGSGPFAAKKLFEELRPDTPDLEGMPATPTMSDAEKAGEEERKRRLRERGRSSTILTGGQGLTSTPSLASRVLIGS